MKRLPTLPLLALVLLLPACGPSAEKVAADIGEIQSLLEAYLPVLGRAYAEQNAELLAEHAAPKEVFRVGQLIDELAMQGSVLEPVFREVTVEDAQIWNNSNAFVITVETWDVRRFVAGTRTPLGQDLGKTHRVKYQLKRADQGGWLILYRTIEP